LLSLSPGDKQSQWYERAAEQGDVGAQVRLAKLYIKGFGVPQNYAEALKLLERAAARRDAEAEFLLGTLYREGKGIPKDLLRAHMWFNLAAAQGHTHALNLRDVAATELDLKQLAEAQNLAVQKRQDKKQ